ncbi:helix-turn-helix transcriptional regulator [Acidovorax sp. 210-6]|uniref:helix-turn-helix domain-containing protein n=1 Tax=Acidovorax sp. 210-6 TaxID=2699468 RepID=UPI0013896A52|nr:helix-turn-helix transcriptional regulator [Acidovorax sp. 210-6]NCU64630.1 helix-turn-helix transcriptional regulator [Acidovorax sp. 210-6]
MDISTRLQEERKRLGLTQEAVAAQLGATKRSVINWEGGAALPGAEVLARYAAAGADVLYILTGQRQGGASAPPPPRAVSEGDRILLDNFHAAPAQVQAGVKTALGAFAPGAGSARRGKQDKAA